MEILFTVNKDQIFGAVGGPLAETSVVLAYPVLPVAFGLGVLESLFLGDGEGKRVCLRQWFEQ